MMGLEINRGKLNHRIGVAVSGFCKESTFLVWLWHNFCSLCGWMTFSSLGLCDIPLLYQLLSHLLRMFRFTTYYLVIKCENVFTFCLIFIPNGMYQ